VSVVAHDTRRRWIIVVIGLALLVAIPLALRAIPVRAAPVSLSTLASRIAASAHQPYQGYAVSTGNAGLPSLPRLDDVTSLFDGETDLRIWYASPTRWRVDTVATAAERDIYQSATGQKIWDYGQNQVTTILGAATVRLPRGADLAPPDLARRLLSAASVPTPAGAPGATFSGVAPRRIAGIDAAGLRLTPTDRATTVGHIDIWADPANGLPVAVEVFARNTKPPVLVSRFMDVKLAAPSVGTTTFGQAPAGAGDVVTTNPDVLGALKNLGLGALPDSLGGLTRSDSGFGVLPGLAAYGTGLRQIVAASVPGRTGFGAFNAARNVGGTVSRYPGGASVVVSTPLLSVLVAFSRSTRSTYIVIGLVGADALTAAGADLAAFTGGDR
jgi:hypothetical protein